MKLLVTGGAGFIGSHFVKGMLDAEDVELVTVLDALTYAGDRANLGEAFLSPKLAFALGDIYDRALVDTLMVGHGAVVHFAAESHVDRSFQTAARFVTTNVIGTQTLADAAMRHGIERFVHVSTDEVYGPLTKGAATEEYPLRPTVPYASSKAASDLMALSYWHTYGAPVCVTRSSNNYGPRQHPEKIIPLFITRLLRGEKVTLHDRGQHMRNWLHVADNCAGIELVLLEGPGHRRRRPLPAQPPAARVRPVAARPARHRARRRGNPDHALPPAPGRDRHRPRRHHSWRSPHERRNRMMRRVLIVCLGNYCRSPFAALALAHRGGTEVEVRSAGLIGKWEGEPAHMAMVKAAGRLGLDLTTHRARQITLEMMAWADTIVAMDTHVRDVLIDVCGESNQSKLAL